MSENTDKISTAIVNILKSDVSINVAFDKESIKQRAGHNDRALASMFYQAALNRLNGLTPNNLLERLTFSKLKQNDKHIIESNTGSGWYHSSTRHHEAGPCNNTSSFRMDFNSSRSLTEVAKMMDISFRNKIASQVSHDIPSGNADTLIYMIPSAKIFDLALDPKRWINFIEDYKFIYDIHAQIKPQNNTYPFLSLIEPDVGSSKPTNSERDKLLNSAAFLHSI